MSTLVHLPTSRIARQWLRLCALALLFALAFARGAHAQTHDHHPPADAAHAAPTTSEAQSLYMTPATAAGGEASVVFHAALSGANETPPVVSRASGYAVLALSDDTTALSYRVLLNDITDVQAAHIHRASDGGVQRPLAVESDALISGVITDVTPAEVTALQNGEYYINVHTTAHPGGEMAGAIATFDPPLGYTALLNGANERPNPVETDAIGVARFTRVNTATLDYQIAVSNVVSITAAHIHLGPADGFGGVAHNLYSGGPFDPDNPITGTVELDHQGMVDLLTGYYYVNVHTDAYPGGELRGQMGGAHLFHANLDGNQETPPVDTLAHGRAVLALSADASTLAYRVIVYDLADITNQHIHRAPRGVPGGVEFPLPTFGDGNVISGTLPMTDLNVLRLIAGDYYVNVHTATHGPGEIRGQIEPLATPMRLSALLTGDAETPSVATDAAGFARFKLRPVINVIDYYMAVVDIEEIQAAHIHTAPAGEPGPVAHFLYTTADGAFDPAHPASGALLFDAQDFVDLLTGYHYVNVHTADHPGGELRGQIGRAHTFVASIDGAQETPPVVTDAFGLGVFALNADASQLVYRIVADGLDGDISVAHIHTGKPGVAGPPDFTLFDGSGLFDSAHPISGALTFTDAHVLKLVSGAYYVNIHTASTNNAGVIRGQIEPLTPPHKMSALLNGAQETPPVDTPGAGVARLALEPLFNHLHYHIAVTETTGITMAHIHRGPAGIPGPVTQWLYRQADGPFDSDHPLIGSVQLNHHDLVDLLSGWSYINVHTVTHLPGEIRGQIGSERAFRAQLDGAKERPTPVTTEATGVGLLTLSSDAQTLHYHLAVGAIVSITMAHIHTGGAEAFGPVRHTLWNDGPGPFDPANPISGEVEMSTSDLFYLAGGNFYINVHTDANPGGEIRGQIDPHQPYGRFQTLLTESEEVAPAAAEARGLAAFHLTPYPLTSLQYQVSVRDIPTVTLAHIHKGLPGESGPPVFTLTNTPGELTADQPLGGVVSLTAAQLLDLLTGAYYVNVHTTELPAGHIRGQLYVDGSVISLLLPLIATN